MNELIINEEAFNGFQVSFTRGSVEIAGYNEIYAALTQLSDYLQHIDVTEDNIKENKKLVARVAKATKEMNRARIDNKKEYMKPFDIYEEQVKELTKLVQQAEDTVRSQIRELEENERSAKLNAIHTIFDKRTRPYAYSEVMNFEDFMKPEYLNKSYPLNKVEVEMTQWLEDTNSDAELLANLALTGDIESLPKALWTYQKTHSIRDTLSTLAKEKEEETEIEEKLVESNMKVPRGVQKTYVNVILEESDFDKIKPILEAMNIEYKCV